MSQLALHGGQPVRRKPFPATITTGEEEVAAASAVIRGGLLSGFVGSPGPEFLGGPTVRRLEAMWAERFEVAHAVSCNSATSALVMAVGAAGIGPGDEVIVSPYTMSATATSILFYGGVPVFADIEADYFCLDPASIAARITPRTKAILTTDIHGQSSDMDAINRLAKTHGLVVITDCAQAPGACYQGKPAGTLGDIGIYSLNRHKNIQCGEGGIAVTNDRELALRLQLIRNHGENLVEQPEFAPRSLVNILGFNFRMTEVEAAIAIEQLKKLDRLNAYRIELVDWLNHELSRFPGFMLPKVRPGATHVYYMHVMRFEQHRAGVSRSSFVRALNAEGIPLRGGYLRPLYLEPLYQQRIAIGARGFPFVGPHYPATADYAKGLCPVAERLWEEESLVNPFVYPPLTVDDMRDIVQGIDKVFANAASL